MASVHLFDGHQAHLAEIRNLSEGGAFLALDPPLPIGTGVTFWLTILGHQLLIRGRVRWTRSLPASDQAPVGIGVEFFDPDGDLVPQIRHQLQRLSDP